MYPQGSHFQPSTPARFLGVHTQRTHTHTPAMASMVSREYQYWLRSPFCEQTHDRVGPAVSENQTRQARKDTPSGEAGCIATAWDRFLNLDCSTTRRLNIMSAVRRLRYYCRRLRDQKQNILFKAEIQQQSRLSICVCFFYTFQTQNSEIDQHSRVSLSPLDSS